MTKHAVIKLSLRATIGEFEFTDIVQYASTFALNSIPTAALTVAVGRSVKDSRLATIHTAVNSLNIQLPVKVYLTAEITSRDRATPGVPDNTELLIFEGKTVGTGWQRTDRGAHFMINVLHWLGDLNYASALSATSHPGNPADFTYPAIFRAIGPDNVNPTSNLNSWVPKMTEQFVNSASLSDIWGNVLHKWITQVASTDPFDKAMLDGAGGPDPNILDAIDRLKPNSAGAPLTLVKEGPADDVVANGIQGALIQEAGGNWVNTTLWGKIIGEWAPAYWFAVVPRVEDALVVPFTSGIRGEQWSVIGVEDYNKADLNTQLHQVLRGVGIVHPIQFATNVDMNKAFIPVDRGGFAGYYSPDDLKTGMVLIKSAPRWLTDPILPELFSNAANGLDGAPVGNAMDEENVGQDNAPVDPLIDNQKRYKNIISRYAEQWYVIEALKGRVGEIAGKLRFDIAPGSNILIEAGSVTSFENDIPENSNVFATVLQVSYIINAQNQTAGTAFSVSHIRTEAENEQEGFAIDGHALYDESWTGAKLVEDDSINTEALET